MDRSARTRARLLRAAAEVFAERGPHAATVRSIVARANANVAAVSYHFRSKALLYEAVLEESFAVLLGPPPGAKLPQDPVARLEGFIAGMLLGAIADQTRRTHARLVAHELLAPTGLLPRLGQGRARPHFLLARQIAADFLPAGTDEATRSFAAAWLVGQCVSMQHMRDGFAELAGAPLAAPAVPVVAAMAIAGLRALAAQPLPLLPSARATPPAGPPDPRPGMQPLGA